MGVYMRAVLAEWDEPPFGDLAAFVATAGPFRVQAAGDKGWADFEALDEHGRTVLAADLSTGADAREELQELDDFLDDLDGPVEAREAVRTHLRAASAVLGMQILMSAYDESVAAANTIIDFLEERERVLTQVDTVGWYEGPDLLLEEPD